MPVQGRPAHRPLAQSRQRVPFCVDTSRLVRRAGRVQQATIFRREDEDQAVDDAQELLEIGVPAERAIGQRLTECAVGRVLNEALAKFEQGRFNALAQFVTRRDPIGSSAFAPAFQRAVRNGGIRLPEPALMDQQPEPRKIWKQAFGEDFRQVGFDPGRPRQADIVAHHAQRHTVTDQTPGGILSGIQVLLQQQGRGSPARAIAELGKAFIDAGSTRTFSRGRRDNDWHAPTKRGVPDWKFALADPRDRLRFEGGESKALAHQIEDEPLRRGGTLATGGLEPRP